MVETKKAKKPAVQWSSEMVIESLRTRYPKGQWTFVEQVPNGTSNNKNRTADAMAMGCWMSSGLDLHGFEVKVSRSDWLREIEDVTKAAAFTKHCHYWWVVTPENIVKLEEMPADWGHMEVSKRGDEQTVIKVRKAATLNQSAAIDFKFFSAAMRAALYQNKDEQRVDKLVQEAFWKGQKKAEESYKQNQEYQRRSQDQQYNDLKRNVEQFEKQTGLTFSGFSAGQEIGRAVRAYISLGQPMETLATAERVVRVLSQQIKDAKSSLTSLEVLQDKSDDDD